jgi:hypothetical protein
MYWLFLRNNPGLKRLEGAMNKSRFQTVLKVIFGLAITTSLLMSSGCSIFVTKETKTVKDDTATTERTTDNVDINTGIQAPAGNVTND